MFFDAHPKHVCITDQHEHSRGGSSTPPHNQRRSQAALREVPSPYLLNLLPKLPSTSLLTYCDESAPTCVILPHCSTCHHNLHPSLLRLPAMEEGDTIAGVAMTARRVVGGVPWRWLALRDTDPSRSALSRRPKKRPLSCVASLVTLLGRRAATKYGRPHTPPHCRKHRQHRSR
jgi:hypothetical protein